MAMVPRVLPLPFPSENNRTLGKAGVTLNLAFLHPIVIGLAASLPCQERIEASHDSNADPEQRGEPARLT